MTRRLQAWPPTAWTPSQAADPHDSPSARPCGSLARSLCGQQATALGLVGAASRRLIQRVIAHYIFANPIITRSSITGGLDPKSAGQAELRGLGRAQPGCDPAASGGGFRIHEPPVEMYAHVAAPAETSAPHSMQANHHADS